MNADAAVDAYVAAIDPAQRPLFDRVAALVAQVHPEATVKISYAIPTYIVGKQRLYIGAWKHGISLYGWRADRDGGFAERHPELVTGKGTIRLIAADAAAIDDSEFTTLIAAALSADA